MYRQTFTGNLANEATFKVIDENKSVVNFVVAVNFLTSKKDEQGNPIKEVVFFPCVKWVKGENKPKWYEYLRKGQKVLIESSYIKTSTSESNGVKYHNFTIYVDSIELLGSKKQQTTNEDNKEFNEYEDVPF